DWLEVKSLNKEIWVETVGNITRYIKEREAAAYDIVTSNNQLIQINVTDNLNNEIYNYPLTAYVKIPDNWQFVRVQQDTNTDTLTTMITDSGRVALIKVTPDKGLLSISPVTSTDINNEDILLNDFILYQNYPNPFNPSTNISYSLGSRQFVSLKIYDMLGKEVAVLVNEYQDEGLHTMEFNVDNLNLSSGIYLYRLQSGGTSSGAGINFSETRKMIYLR
ncbi:MAG: T9SS type A sorting domain-containing protein, partial [Ignavibacteriaceae bacterium]|nr:T9SS type A sorting domain-containing protein [Ignavibacteriaceae bacterium]